MVEDNSLGSHWDYLAPLSPAAYFQGLVLAAMSRVVADMAAAGTAAAGNSVDCLSGFRWDLQNPVADDTHNSSKYFLSSMADTKDLEAVDTVVADNSVDCLSDCHLDPQNPVADDTHWLSSCCHAPAVWYFRPKDCMDH